MAIRGKELLKDALYGLHNATFTVYLENRIETVSKKITYQELKYITSMIDSGNIDKYYIFYEKHFGRRTFFKIFAQHSRVPAVSSKLLLPEEEALMNSVYVAQQSKKIGPLVTNKLGEMQATSSSVKQMCESAWLQTEIGQKMHQLAIKDYEKQRITKIEKRYDKLLKMQDSNNICKIFNRCYERAFEIHLKQAFRIDQAYENFKNDTSLSAINQQKIHVQHIFSLTVDLKIKGKEGKIESIQVNGFHHDEGLRLEQAGLYACSNVQYGPNGCYKADLTLNDGLQSSVSKTFFPASWSPEKVLEVITTAALPENRIQEIVMDDNPKQKKYECKGIDNMRIDVIMLSDGTINSAFPSMINFEKDKV